jgi:hypothetical protein
MSCIFCRRNGKMSREHLWPRWAQEVLSEEQRGQRVPHSLEPHDGPPKAWDAVPFSATLRDVCVECNNGWMNAIEEEARPFMEPLMRGEEGGTIEPLGAQWAISRWAYLKVLLFERVDTRQSWIPEHRCHEMYEASIQAEPELPADMSVFLAAHEDIRIGQYAHRLLGDATSGKPELFMGTITMLHLVVQAVADIAEDGEVKAIQRDKRIAGHDARIWPFCEPFEWPPGLALTDAGLEVFAGPKPGDPPMKVPGRLAMLAHLLRRTFSKLLRRWR